MHRLQRLWACLMDLMTAWGQEETYKQHARFAALMGDVTYKPGWVFTTSAQYGSITLRVQWPVTCVVTGKEITLHFIRSYSWRDIEHFKDADLIRYIVYNFVHEAEEHELREWLRYKHDHVIDPHPEHKKTPGV